MGATSAAPAKFQHTDISLLREVVACAHESFAVVQDGRFLLVNTAFAGLLHANPENLEGACLESVLPQCRSCNSEVSPAGAVRRCQVEAATAAGSALGLVVECNSFQLGSGRVRVLNAETQAASRDRPWRQFWSERVGEWFGSAGFGVVQCDLDGRLLQANRAFERMIAPSSSLSAGQRIFDLASLQDPASAAIEFSQLVAGHGAYFQADARIARDDGLHWVRLTFCPVPGAGQPPAFVLVIAEDTTSQHHVERELDDARKMEAMGRLTGGVAHDFNNLLTGVTLYADLIVGELPQASAARRYARAIRSAAQQGGALVHQLMSVVRHEAAGRQVFSLNDVVAELRDMLARLIGENICLRTTVDPDLRAVRMDRAQLQQILFNLVLNARDALPQGGSIVVETRNRRDANAAGSAAVELVVRDTGCGMDAGTLAHAFDPFFTTKRNGQSHGLGLSTVRRIVEQENGAIQVESQAGCGTRISICFPAYEPFNDPAELSPTGVAHSPAARANEPTFQQTRPTR